MNSILNILIYSLVRLLNSTYRYYYEGNEVLLDLKKNKQNFILAIWHQNLLPGILAQTGHSHIVIISKSKDAEVVSYTCKKLGHQVVRGSSKKNGVHKNGKEAKEMMIETLKKGYPGAVTVDGPKGPRLIVKPGIIDMAKESSSTIVPYTVTPKTYWQFKSWDLFRLPKPFSEILVTYGQPVFVDNDKSTFESDRLKLENSLINEKDSAEKKVTSCKNYSSHNWWN